MSKITNFDKQNLQTLRAAIDAALSKVAEDFELQSISLGTIRFDQQQFSAKLTAQTKSTTTGQPSVKGLFPSAGEKRRSGNQIFEVTAIDRSRPKYPISVKNQNNTRYKLSIDQWEAMMPF